MKTDYEMIFDLFKMLYAEGRDVDVERLTKRAIEIWHSFDEGVEHGDPFAREQRNKIIKHFLRGLEEA
jgi:hypothetical protein